MLNLKNFPKTASRIRFIDEDEDAWYAISYVSNVGLGFAHNYSDEDTPTGRHMKFSELIEEDVQWSSGDGKWAFFKAT